jgi:hypothetical protein
MEPYVEGEVETRQDESGYYTVDEVNIMESELLEAE